MMRSSTAFVDCIMLKIHWYGFFVGLLTCLVFFDPTQVSGRIITPYEAVQLLQNHTVSRSLWNHWICLMKFDGHLTTDLVTGPYTKSTHRYGVFQISSLKWCGLGRPGGKCHSSCDRFTDENLDDDIACAIKIQGTEGFKHWAGWMKHCKGKLGKLPDYTALVSNKPAGYLQRRIDELSKYHDRRGSDEYHPIKPNS